MASKGGNKHLKRYAAPRALKLSRKTRVWTTKTSPGPHVHNNSIPLRLVIRDYLALGRTAREVDRTLHDGNVLVDGKIRKEPSFPIGLMDIVQLPALNRSYRVFLDHRGRLIMNDINSSEASTKLCKVAFKHIVRGKKVQLTFHDGKTIVGDLNEFKPGDVARLTLPELKVLEHIPFEVGAMALVTGGSNVSKTGEITEVKLITGNQPNVVTLKKDGESFKTPEHYVFVVGRGKPPVSLPGVKI